MGEPKEQRRSRRIRHDLKVELFDKRGARVLHALDVARHGLFLATTDPPRDRHLVQLLVYLPDGPIKVAATVMRTVKTQHDFDDGVGVQFFALSEDAKRRWDDFVFELQRTTPPRGTPRPKLGGQKSAEGDMPGAGGATFLVKLKTVERLREFAQTHLHSGGTVLFTPVLRAAGEHVTLVCVHPRTDEEFHLPGVVHRVHTDKPKRLELHFIGVSAQLLNNFAAFVESGHPPRVQAVQPPAVASPPLVDDLDVDVDVFDEDTIDTDQRIAQPPSTASGPPSLLAPPLPATTPPTAVASAAPAAVARQPGGPTLVPGLPIDPGLRPEAYLLRCDACELAPYAIDLGPCRGVLGLVADYGAFSAKDGRVVGAPRMVSAEERHKRVQHFLSNGGRLDASIDLMTMFGVVALAEPAKDEAGDLLRHPKAVERLDHVARKLAEGEAAAKTKVKCPACKDGHLTVERSSI
ncbi:MAG: PilZ domain-containing protein [Deltaproteobacteria bacterium]|nr:PilZ domain-containing protein [Deltaproteobacteria bacterium]